jgi:TPP-dependent pyruvate/acetoin dehydrogenase alpha subunit
MCEVFEAALAEMRETHVPALFHVEEITQPQGHSTSGSHERYKTHERLQWEKEWDCIKKFREWIIANGLASEDELSEIEADAKAHARESKIRAWTNYIAPIKDQVEKTVRLLNGLKFENNDASALLKKRVIELQTNRDPLRRDIMKTLSTVLQIAPSAKRLRNIIKN